VTSAWNEFEIICRISGSHPASEISGAGTLTGKIRMEILTPLQQQVLQAIGRSPLREEFYLTGGTALAAYYLQHRFSEDLDFFSANPRAPGLVPGILEQALAELNVRTTFRRIFPSFVECFIEAPHGERVELDFAQDSPFRFEPTWCDDRFGVHIDSQVDLCCNKLSALFERAESKDFVDVYMIAQRLMSRDRLLTLAQQKHVGLEDYWLAQSIVQVNRITFLPRMITPITIDDLKPYFEGWAAELMQPLRGDK
jgi:hypothetical protein